MVSASVSREMVTLNSSANVDFEWYPSSAEILDIVKADLKAYREEAFNNSGSSTRQFSLIDPCAGDGRALLHLGGEHYLESLLAIEVSPVLRAAQPKEITLIGTDFFEQSLIDKPAFCLYLNPPYSAFAKWLIRCIDQSSVNVMYAVVPARWESNADIRAALMRRNAAVTVVAEDRFFEKTFAQRKARGVIHILRISFCEKSIRGMTFISNSQVDSFDRWFDETFPFGAVAECASEPESLSESRAELVDRENQVDWMVSRYDARMSELCNTYQLLGSVDRALLSSLGLDVSNARQSLRRELAHIKSTYWKELFDKMDLVTDKLTSQSRDVFLDKINSNVHVDFTRANCEAIVSWAVKHANDFIESQFLKQMESMLRLENVKPYKSNERTFGKDKWRYNSNYDLKNRGSHFKLDYRCVLPMGGINESKYVHEAIGGLDIQGVVFLDDFITIAANMGLDVSETERCASGARTWERGKTQLFEYRDKNSGLMQPLFEVKAFINGNLWLRFGSEFILMLNVMMFAVKVSIN